MAGPVGSPYRTAPLRVDDTFGGGAHLSVVARWDDEILAVAHLRPGERFVLAPHAVDPLREPHALAHPDVDAPRTVAEHRPDGTCVALGHPDPLVDDAPAFHAVGPVSFAVRRVPMPEPIPRTLLDAGARRTLAIAVALLVLVVVAAAWSRRSPPEAALRPAHADEREALLRALSARWSRGAIRTARTGPPVELEPIRYPEQQVTTHCFCADEKCPCRFKSRRHVRGVFPNGEPRVSCRSRRGRRWVEEPGLGYLLATTVIDRPYPHRSIRLWCRREGDLKLLSPTGDVWTSAINGELWLVRVDGPTRGHEVRCRLHDEELTTPDVPIA